MTARSIGAVGSTASGRWVLSTLAALVSGLLIHFDAALAPLDDDLSLGADHPVNASSFPV